MLYIKYFFYTVIWIFLFSSISFVFVIVGFYPFEWIKYNMVISWKLDNFLISMLYVIAWFIVSVWSGYKRFSFILIAAMVYSLYPVAAFAFLSAYVDMFILFQLGFIWSVPIQGFQFIYDSNTIFYILAVLLPAIFILGYYIGIKFRSRKE